MADGTDDLGQEEVEELLRQAGNTPEKDESPGQDSAASSNENLDQDQGEQLRQQAADSGPQTADEPGQGPGHPPASAEPGAGSTDSTPDQVEAVLGETETDSHPSPVATEQPADPQTAPAKDDDVELLLAQAEEALRSIDAPDQGDGEGLAPFELKDLTGSRPNTQKASLSLLRDVELDLRIELGRTHMYLEDVLQLRKGTVVALDKLAGDPVDIFVNGRLVARGEILVLNDNFCVRVADLVSGEEVA